MSSFTTTEPFWVEHALFRMIVSVLSFSHERNYVSGNIKNSTTPVIITTVPCTVSELLEIYISLCKHVNNAKSISKINTLKILTLPLYSMIVKPLQCLFFSSADKAK